MRREGRLLEKNVIYLMGLRRCNDSGRVLCRQKQGQHGAEDSSEFVLTYAENQAEDYPTTQGAYKFAELVYEQTGGRVEIQVNAGGVLGDEKTVIEQLQFGGWILPGYPCRPWLSLCPS